MEAEISRIVAIKVNKYLAKGKTMRKKEVSTQNQLLVSFYTYLNNNTITKIEDIPSKYNEILK